MKTDRPTRVRYAVLGAACTLALLAYIHRVGFGTAGTYMKRDLGLTDAEWSHLTTVFLIAYGVFEMPWGILGDRLGARAILTIAALGWTILTACVPLVLMVPGTGSVGVSIAQLGFLMAARFLFGMFQAAAFPAISRMMADWMPIRERATAQGIVWMASRIGGATSPFLMVWLVGQAGGWESCLQLLALPGILWCLLFWTWFRSSPREMRGVNDAERVLIEAGRAPRARAHGPVPWRLLLGSRNVWALCLMYGFGGCTATFFITLLPAYLLEHRGLGEEEMQWLSGLPLAFGVLACLGGGMISDRIIRRTGNRKWGRRLNGALGYTCAGFALLATNSVEDVWALGALLCLTFTGFDIAMGPAWAACADIGERHAGAVAGAMNMVGNFGAAAGSIVAGRLMGENNDLLFIFFSVSFWLGALCWLQVDVTRTLDGGRAA